MNELTEMFLKEKPVKVLIGVYRLDDAFGRQLRGFADTTYPHTVNILNRFVENGLVTGEKKGRKKIYSLTSRGESLAKSLESTALVLDAGFIKSKSEKE